MKSKLLMLVIICITFTTTLTGCWDKNELEDWGYIAAIGIDTYSQDKFLITYQITNPQVGTSSKTSVPEPPQEVVSFPTKNISTSKDIANTFVTRKLTMSHAIALIVSEEMARSEKFYHIVEDTIRDKDIRGDINLIICAEKASDFIKNNRPNLETRPNKYYSFMIRRWEDTGLVPISSLHRLIKRTESDGGLFLSIYSTTISEGEDKLMNQDSQIIAGEVGKSGGDKVEMLGSAVFKDGKMIGKLTGFETQLALLLRDKTTINSFSINIKDPIDENYYISVSIIPNGSTKIKINFKDSIPSIDVTTTIDADVIGIPSFVNYVTDLDNQKTLKSSIQNYLETSSEILVKKTKEQFKGEPFLWEAEAKKYFKTNKDFKDYMWGKRYSNANVNIKFKVNLRGFGKGLNSPSRR